MILLAHILLLLWFAGACITARIIKSGSLFQRLLTVFLWPIAWYLAWRMLSPNA